MRRSDARPIAADMQPEPVRGGHKDAREALAQTSVCGWAAASLLKLSFPMASMKEHRLVADGYVCATEPPQGKRRCSTKRARLIASAQPSTRTNQWVSIPPAANRTSVSGSKCLLSAGPWHQYWTVSRLDFQPAATILQTESSRQSTTTYEKCHPRPRHRSAA
jgi:hypothetical protein